MKSIGVIDELRKKEEYCLRMRRSQRASTSSGSAKSQQRWSGDSEDQTSPSETSSDEDTFSLSDVEAEGAMKRSPSFSSSFSLEEDQNHQSTTKGKEEESLLRKPGGVKLTEPEGCEFKVEFRGMEKRNALGDTNQSRATFFKPQALWLAVTRCLSLRWPPCLSTNRQSSRKLTYQEELDQSEDTQSSESSKSTNGSTSSSSFANNQDVTLVKHEEEKARSKVVKGGPPPGRGISQSSPRLPRARQATDSVLASMILEKEMFLTVELVDSGGEKEDFRYYAEWKLSERTKELAEGVWLSRSQNILD